MSYISGNSRVRNFKSAPCCALVWILKLLARLVTVIVRSECNTRLIVLIYCSYLFHGTFTDDKWIKMAGLWNVKGELINNSIDIYWCFQQGFSNKVGFPATPTDWNDELICWDNIVLYNRFKDILVILHFYEIFFVSDIPENKK